MLFLPSVCHSDVSTVRVSARVMTTPATPLLPAMITGGVTQRRRPKCYRGAVLAARICEEDNLTHAAQCMLVWVCVPICARPAQSAAGAGGNLPYTCFGQISEPNPITPPRAAYGAYKPQEIWGALQLFSHRRVCRPHAFIIATLVMFLSSYEGKDRLIVAHSQRTEDFFFGDVVSSPAIIIATPRVGCLLSVQLDRGRGVQSSNRPDESDYCQG